MASTVNTPILYYVFPLSLPIRRNKCWHNLLIISEYRDNSFLKGRRYFFLTVWLSMLAFGTIHSTDPSTWVLMFTSGVSFWSKPPVHSLFPLLTWHRSERIQISSKWNKVERCTLQSLNVLQTPSPYVSLGNICPSRRARLGGFQHLPFSLSHPWHRW